MRRVSITITGRVQGVGYRYFAEEAAESLGITGWVRNTAERTVELEAQGESAELDDFLSRLREGPPLSRVKDVVTCDLPVEQGESSFGVRY